MSRKIDQVHSPVPVSLTAHDLADLFKTHRDEFLAYARRLLGASTESEEVVQDALLRVLLASPELKSTDHARAYFYKVIENLTVDRHRREGRQPRLVLLDDAIAEIESMRTSNSDLSEVLVQADDAAVIREAISLLSHAERAALVMWEFENRSTLEIARELGVDESSVRHTLSRARAKLRKLLSERIINEEYGYTALDLLSISFRRTSEVVKKSSRVALSAVLVVAAFLGFNSLLPSNFFPEQSEVFSVEVSPKGETSSQPSKGGEILLDVSESIDANVVLEETITRESKIRTQEFNSSEVEGFFSTLDEFGAPTGFNVEDAEGRVGRLFSGQTKVTITETGLLLSNIVSTQSGATNVLLKQNVSIDAFGTSYLADILVGIEGAWHLLGLSDINVNVERLASGNYLLVATMVVDSLVEASIKVATNSSGADLTSAPEFISTRLLLDASKTMILAQTVLVSAISQENGA